MQKIWKNKNVLFKTVPGIFISKLISGTKVFRDLVFLILKKQLLIGAGG